MKRLRILPSAAGIIALTATIGFVDGQREIEGENFSRGRVTLVSVSTHISNDVALPDRRLNAKPESSAYLVEIQRGNISTNLLVDAVTGRVLKS